MNHHRTLLTAAAGSLAALGAFGADRQQPNIVLFLVDDMGWQDTSLPFHKERTPLNDRFHTPNMERLAERGTMFTNAYASSISSPSRCSLLTGMNAARHRVTTWTLRYNRPTDAPDSILTFPEWNCNGIQPVKGIERSTHATSFVSILKDNGYHTIHCGKAHFGAQTTPGADPTSFGFDVNIAGSAAGGLASYLGEERFGHDSAGRPVSDFAIPGLERYWDKDVFVTEALTTEALKALDRAPGDSPFFLYLSHYAVHVPIQADKRFIDKYLAMGLSETEAAYSTLVEGMDKSLGDIMDYLEHTGQADNTIIIFMSDNGGFTFGSRSPDMNAPLRYGKGSVYEGGTREPMIVCWPGVTAPGSRTDDCVIIEDFFPSILDMAGISDYTTVQTVDGKSFVPILKGTGDNDGRCFVWHTPNLWDSGEMRQNGVGATSAIRQGTYKLVYWYKYNSTELYDLAEDIGERHDIAAERPEIAADLSRKLSDYLRSVGAQRPTFTATGRTALWPDGEE